MVCFFLSCSDITEQEMVYQAGFYQIAPGDLSVTASVTDVSGARCLMIYPARVFVSSSNGIVSCFDAEDLSLIDEYTVGAASPAGYSSMVYSPGENSAYLIGAQGKILELSMPYCEVLHEFSVSMSAVELALTDGIPGNLWVVDGPENSIHQIDLSTNQSTNTLNFTSVQMIQCLEPCRYYPDSLLVGTSKGVYKLQLLPSGSIRKTFLLPTLPYSWIDLCSIPNDSNFIAIRTSNTFGELCPYDTTTSLEPLDAFYNKTYVEGDLWITAPGNDNINIYALGYLGQGVSRLYRYSYIGPSFGVNGYADFQGYPLDLKVSDSGNIYLLTME